MAISLKKYQILKQFTKSLSEDELKMIQDYENDKKASQIKRNELNEAILNNKSTSLNPKRFDNGFFELDVIRKIFEIHYKKLFNVEFIYTENNKKSMEVLFLYFGKNPKFLELDESFSFDKGIGLFGGTGTGKTTIMQTFESIGKEFYNKHGSLFFWMQMTNCKKIAFDYQSDELKRDLNALYCGGVRCFDDLGAETLAFGSTNCLEHILEFRYENQFNKFKPNMKTSFTTNLTASRKNNNENNGILEFYGSRVEDRLRQMTNYVYFGGQSFRK